MAENQVLQTDKKVIEDLQKRAKYSNAKTLRNMQTFIPITTSNLQRQLDLLRAQKDFIQLKIDTFKTVKEVQEESADRFMTKEPIQAFGSLDVGVPIHGDIVIQKNKIQVETVGSEDLKSRRDLIENQIKRVQSTKKEYEAILDEVTKKLGGPGAPTAEDMEKDNMRSSLAANVLLLYQLSQRYRKITIGADGKRAFSEEVKVQKTMDTISEQFRAIANRIPRYLNDPANPKKTTVLDFIDPGSNKNISILETDSDCFRQRLPTEVPKFDQKIAKYVDDLDRSLNDPFVSKNAIRSKEENSKLVQLIDSFGSLKEKTKDLATWFNTVTWPNWTKYDLKNLDDSITRRFQQGIKRLYQGKPFCQSDPPLSGEESAQKEYREQQEKLQQDAFNSVMKELEDKCFKSITSIFQSLNS